MAAVDPLQPPPNSIPYMGPPPQEPVPASGEKKRLRDDGDEDLLKRQYCRCKKSKCRKLYCVCYSTGVPCSEFCWCESCSNMPSCPAQQTRKPMRVFRKANVNQPFGDFAGKGCTCISGCRKSDCECKQSHFGCGFNCKCEECFNPFGKKVSFLIEGQGLGAPAEQNGLELIAFSESDDDFPPSFPPLGFSFKKGSQVGRDYQTAQVDMKPLQVWQKPLPPNSERDSRSEEQQYSITKCIEAMNAMELTLEEMAMAPDVFLEQPNREIFLSLAPDIRLVWLRRKIPLM